MASSIKGTTDESLDVTVSDVAFVLKIAEKSGMEAEVLATALIYLKENPQTTIGRALYVGMSDWDL
jgi:phage protein D